MNGMGDITASGHMVGADVGAVAGAVAAAEAEGGRAVPGGRRAGRGAAMALQLGWLVAACVDVPPPPSAVRREVARWWLAGAVRYRFHLFSYDRGGVEVALPATVSVGGGLRARTWSAGVVFDTTVDVFAAGSSDGDHFRHLVRAGVERRMGRWRASAGVVAPIDVEARALQTPMIALGLGRELGG